MSRLVSLNVKNAFSLPLAKLTPLKSLKLLRQVLPSTASCLLIQLITLIDGLID